MITARVRGGDRRFDVRRVHAHAVLRTQRHGDRAAAAQHHFGVIGSEERRGNNHFIAGAHHGFQRQKQANRGTVNGLNLGFGIISKSLHTGGVIGHGLAVFGDAKHVGVPSAASLCGLASGRHDMRRGRGAGLPHGQ